MGWSSKQSICLIFIWTRPNATYHPVFGRRIIPRDPVKQQLGLLDATFQDSKREGIVFCCWTYPEPRHFKIGDSLLFGMLNAENLGVLVHNLQIIVETVRTVTVQTKHILIQVVVFQLYPHICGYIPLHHQADGWNMLRKPANHGMNHLSRGWYSMIFRRYSNSDGYSLIFP